MGELPPFEPYIVPDEAGTLLRWPQVASAHLAHPRDILIWLPPGYARGDRLYPVLYLQDGQNKFDPATAYAGEDWQLGQQARHLIETGKIDPFIMVAPYNSPARLAEYNPLEQGGAYGRFLMGEVHPLIERAFRVQAGRAHAVMGSSMGGLIALALALWYPATLRGAACLSPSLWILWRAGGPLAWLRKQPHPHPAPWLYFDHGTEGFEARIGDPVKSVMKHLRRRGMPPAQLHYHIGEGGAHDERSWRARVAEPLHFLFGL